MVRMANFMVFTIIFLKKRGEKAQIQAMLAPTLLEIDSNDE